MKGRIGWIVALVLAVALGATLPKIISTLAPAPAQASGATTGVVDWCFNEDNGAMYAVNANGDVFQGGNYKSAPCWGQIGTADISGFGPAVAIFAYGFGAGANICVLTATGRDFHYTIPIGSGTGLNIDDFCSGASAVPLVERRSWTQIKTDKYRRK